MTEQAVSSGARIVMEPKDQFYGERSSRVLDPFGHEWLLWFAHRRCVTRRNAAAVQRYVHRQREFLFVNRTVASGEIESCVHRFGPAD